MTPILLCVAALVGLTTFPLLLHVGHRHPLGTALSATTVGAFSASLEGVTRSTLAGKADEVACIVCVFVALSHKLRLRERPARTPGLVPFTLFLACGLVSSTLRDVPVSTTFPSLLLVAKGVLIAWSIAQLPVTCKDLLRIRRSMAWLVGFISLCVLLNFLMPGTWSNLLGASISTRLGRTSLVGPFVHPLMLGNVAAAFCIMGFAYLITARGAGAVVFSMSMFLATFASFRRTAIAGLLAGAMYVATTSRRAGALIFGCLGSAAVAIALEAQIRDLVSTTWAAYITTSTQARTELTHYALVVADRYAPFGAGFGRYGSFYAGINYSPIYREFGFDRIWGLSLATGNAEFLYDTQWPAILGETGYLGCLCFIAFLVSMWRYTSPLLHSEDSAARWWGCGVRGAFVALLLASSAMPVFYSAPFNSVLFGFLGVAFGLQNTANATVASGSSDHDPRRTRGML